MIIAFTLAQPWFRRNRLNLPKTIKRLTGFNAFWYSHHLFVIVYVLFIIHGYYLYLSKKWYKKTVSILIHIQLFSKRKRHPNDISFHCRLQTWMYLAVPVLLYACERLIRAFRSGYKTVRILKVYIYTLTLCFFVCLPRKFTNFSREKKYQELPADRKRKTLRLLCILETFWHCKCQSLMDSNTQVGSTYM